MLQLCTNLRGWKSQRKLLVIESDDWGAIRMPNRQAWDRLVAAGIRVDKSRYDSLDCLETKEDLQELLNIIDAHRDTSGRPATFTFNTVMGNPDFELIERDGFERFHHQYFFNSYQHYHGQDLEGDWCAAMRNSLIRPQFHAREHVNSPLWMADLRSGFRDTRFAFDLGFYGIKTSTSSPRQKNYLAAHWPDTPDHLASIKAILDDGLGQFKKTFGFRPTTYIGCNYVWPHALESHLAGHGVKQLQTQRGHIEPDPILGGATRIRRHYTGQKNRHGQRYSVRNVLFEPYLGENIDWATRALGEVGQAFWAKTPAIVCSHRINYVSGMDLQHRNNSLVQLNRFLRGVLERWPDVEFITSDELSEIMSTT